MKRFRSFHSFKEGDNLSIQALQIDTIIIIIMIIQYQGHLFLFITKTVTHSVIKAKYLNC